LKGDIIYVRAKTRKENPHYKIHKASLYYCIEINLENYTESECSLVSDGRQRKF